MNDIGSALAHAVQLIATGDRELVRIAELSLRVSLSAVTLASALALPLGALLAIARFPGRRVLVVIANAFMGLPPVVVGLLVYLGSAILFSDAIRSLVWGLPFLKGYFLRSDPVLESSDRN